jgi:hypothetical protein
MDAPLSETGAAALVGSMGTDIWAATKSGFAYLLGDGSTEGIAAWEVRLEESAGRVAAGDGAGQVSLWRAELDRFLAAEPTVEPRLSALIEELSGRLADDEPE